MEKKKDMKTECKDHLGNMYSSITDMCRFYKITRSTYKNRIKLGWSLKDTLTIPMGGHRPNVKITSGTAKHIIDHRGNMYDSITEMCNFYGIAINTYCSRIKLGWSIEEILTTPINEHRKNIKYISGNAKQITDHRGNMYDSISEMCRVYKITPGMYCNRVRLGWSLEEILTTPLGKRRLNVKRTSGKAKKVKDHLGNTYDSITAMYAFYGITASTYCGRIKLGWSLKDTLTIPTNIHRPNTKWTNGIQVMDHLGNIYGSISELCRFYNISTSSYQGRIERGWTLEEALTIPKQMYIGEYRVAECLKKLNVKFYHNCTIKRLFTDLKITINWDEFINVLTEKIHQSGYKWTKEKIQRLRPDFVLYTDDNNRICGVIEFDGEQHQTFIEHFFKTIEMFLMRSTADFVKNNLWEYLNIPMLRIRHDQIDMIDDMVLDFIRYPENYFYNHNTYLTEDEYWADLNEEKQKLDLVFAG